VKNELVNKAREAALAAVQVFNNPLITFKSEMFVVTIHIAWTYLLHAYFRSQGIEYRYVKSTGPSGRRLFDTTKSGAHKYWSLEDCLNSDQSPIDKDTANNLRFLIGLRHEIEHQMTNKIDDALSARFQACCLNFNEAIKNLFGTNFGIDRYLSFSLQFSSLTEEHVQALESYKEILPRYIAKFVEDYDGTLSEEEYNSPKFSYRVLFTPKTANRLGQADRVIEFIKPGSETAMGINKTYALVREKEKRKYRVSTIISMLQEEGYPNFTQHQHTKLWKHLDAKNPTKGFGVMVEGYWYWYDNWLNTVRLHCQSYKGKYKND